MAPSLSFLATDSMAVRESIHCNDNSAARDLRFGIYYE